MQDQAEDLALRREAAMSSNLSIQDIALLCTRMPTANRQRTSPNTVASNLPIEALWKSIFSAQAKEFLKHRGKFLTSPVDIPDLNSDNIRAEASLSININETGIMMVEGIPIEEFWEIFFSQAGANYLGQRGLLVGDIIESSNSSSATRSALPQSVSGPTFGLSGTLGDILANPVYVESAPNTPPPVQSIEGNVTLNAIEEEEQTENEESSESLDILVSSSNSGTRGSNPGHQSPTRGGRVATRMTAREYKQSFLVRATAGSSTDSVPNTVHLHKHLFSVAYQHSTDTLRTITMRRYLNVHCRTGLAADPHQPPKSP